MEVSKTDKFTLNIVSDEDMELLRTIKKERKEKEAKQKELALTEAEVWLDAFCATASCYNATNENAVEWADKCLAEFKRRFM